MVALIELQHLLVWCMKLLYVLVAASLYVFHCPYVYNVDMFHCPYVYNVCVCMFISFFVSIDMRAIFCPVLFYLFDPCIVWRVTPVG